MDVVAMRTGLGLTPAQRIRLLILAGALTVGCCAAPAPSPAPTVADQIRECGRIEAAICEEAIQAVIAAVPAMAGSPVAAAGTRELRPPSGYGGATVVVVAFAPLEGLDPELGPPAWIATKPQLADAWLVEPWSDGLVPSHIVQLIGNAMPSAS